MCLASAIDLTAILGRRDCVTCGATLPAERSAVLLCPSCAGLSSRRGFAELEVTAKPHVGARSRVTKKRA